VAVAVSGGRDSTALLHATAQAAPALGVAVVALHVHHGLQPQADLWVERVRRQCGRLRARGLPVRFAYRRLEGRPASGDSIEAWARRGRYAALAEMAREAGASIVLLAQHRRDQAETFLLQALRGAGPDGLAAMPRSVERGGLTWARPWIDASDEAIDAYRRRHRLRPVDDPSNADPAFARNRLRLHVLPALRGAFADAEVALAAAARRAQEARQALREIAAIDVAAACDGDGALVVERWQSLAAARRLNALRAWLLGVLGRGAPQTLVQRLAEELPGRGPARWPAPGGMLERHRGRVRWHPTPTLDARAGPPPAVALGTLGPGDQDVPAWGGRLRVRKVADGGVALQRLVHCELRPRTGGERFRLPPNGAARSLKKQFQALGVAAAARDVPLLYCGAHLVFVPGLGIDAGARAPAGVPQASIEWVPDTPVAPSATSGCGRARR
jgi:tRNA(Ile)-lysidine synthase